MGIMGSGKARCEVPERFKTQQAWGTWGMAPASHIFPGEGGFRPGIGQGTGPYMFQARPCNHSRLSIPFQSSVGS